MPPGTAPATGHKVTHPVCQCGHGLEQVIVVEHQDEIPSNAVQGLEQQPARRGPGLRQGGIAAGAQAQAPPERGEEIAEKGGGVAVFRIQPVPGHLPRRGLQEPCQQRGLTEARVGRNQREAVSEGTLELLIEAQPVENRCMQDRGRDLRGKHGGLRRAAVHGSTPLRSGLQELLPRSGPNTRRGPLHLAPPSAAFCADAWL